MTDIENIIRDRIRDRGRITFAEFMEMALYYPGLGYYTSGKDRIGADGDFYTAPSTHPTFASLIALQIEEMWRCLGAPPLFTLVEMGAGKGLLARDFINSLPKLSAEFTSALDYVTMERDGLVKRTWPQRGGPTDLSQITGCVMSNELVDALPVHRVAMQNGKLVEVYVNLKNDTFNEETGEPSTPALAARLNDDDVLPEGYRTEINLGIEPWLDRVSSILKTGFLLTVDYGYTAAEYYASERNQGTLMTYYRHMTNSDPYVRIGEQDITAHVDFSAVNNIAGRHGFDLVGQANQHDFLHRLGLEIFLEALTRRGLPYSEYLANRMAILDLVRPEGFGRFQVLAHGKGVEAECLLSGFTPDSEVRQRLRQSHEALRTPLLDDRHISQMKMRYPEAEGASDAW